jgi:hypothetical protein
MSFGALLEQETLRDEGIGQESAPDEVVDATFMAPVVSASMSLDAVKPKFRDLVAGVDAMVAQAQGMKVSSVGDVQNATALGVDAKRIAKLIEAKRKDVIAPYSEFVSSVNNFCSLFMEKLVLNAKKTNGSCIEAILKPKILGYQAKVELERRKKEEEARRIKDELQAKLDAEAAKMNQKAEEEARQKAIADAQAAGAGAVETAEAVQAAVAVAQENKVEAPVVPDLVVPQNSAPVRTENGGAAYGAKTWVCVIVDPSLVPREFCAPVQKLLNDAVKQGVRSIAGCEIKEEQSLRFRS